MELDCTFDVKKNSYKVGNATDKSLILQNSQNFGLVPDLIETWHTIKSPLSLMYLLIPLEKC